MHNFQICDYLLINKTRKVFDIAYKLIVVSIISVILLKHIFLLIYFKKLLCIFLFLILQSEIVVVNEQAS